MKDQHIRSSFDIEHFCNCAAVKELTAARKIVIAAQFEQCILIAGAQAHGIPPTSFAELRIALHTHFKFPEYKTATALLDSLKGKCLVTLLQQVAMKDPAHFEIWGRYKDCADLMGALQDIAKTYLYA